MLLEQTVIAKKRKRYKQPEFEAFHQVKKQSQIPEEVNGHSFGGEKGIWKVKMFQKMSDFIHPKHLQIFFHKKISGNLTL